MNSQEEIKITPSKLYEVASTSDPELFRYCEPRRYTGFGPCNSPKSAVAARYTAFRNTIEEETLATSDPAKFAAGHNEVTIRDPHMRMAFVATLRSLEFDHPTYFVAPEFLQAVVHTRLPENLATDEIEWPQEAMTFILPRGSVIAPIDGECTFLTVARIPANWQAPRWMPGPTPIIRDALIHVFTIAEDNGAPLFASALPIEGTTTSTWGRQDFPMTFYTDGGAKDVLGQPMLDPNLRPDERDQKFIRDMRDLALKLVIVCSARPELIESESLARPARIKHGRERGELWNPRVIGRQFKVHRQTEYKGGTHASPRMHWRDGHARLQPFGPRSEKNRKSIWIAPTLVNANSPAG